VEQDRTKVLPLPPDATLYAAWLGLRSFRQARYSGGRLGHGRGTVQVTIILLHLNSNSTHTETVSIDRIICAVQKPLVLMSIGPLIPYQLRSDFACDKKMLLSFFLYGSPSMS